MERSQMGQIVQEAAVFALLTSEQKGQIVRTLRRQGERVAMVGDAAHDIPAMEEADLRITLRSSSQVTLGLADIVLLEDSFQVLPTVLERGQNIVNGLLDILKINLSQIGYILLLTIIMFLSDRRIFYYHPTQGGIIAFFTVIVPSVGLTLWASSGTLPRQYMRSRLWHFVVPAAVTMTLASLAVSWIFGRGLIDIAYSQLAVTYLLVVIGLVLIVFVQPPTRFWVGGDVLSRDWRNTYMAIVLLLLFIVITFLPLTQELFRLTTLQGPWAYAVIGAVAVVWTFLVRAIWRAPWLNRYVGTLSKRLEKS
jgi:cation-transporting ATPase E